MRYISTTKRGASWLAAIAVLGMGWLGTAGAAPTSNHEEVANNLAVLFKAARMVISDNQELINDETKGDKGLSAGKVLEQTKQNYKKLGNKRIGASIDKTKQNSSWAAADPPNRCDLCVGGEFTVGNCS